MTTQVLPPLPDNAPTAQDLLELWTYRCTEALELWQATQSHADLEDLKEDEILDGQNLLLCAEGLRRLLPHPHTSLLQTLDTAIAQSLPTLARCTGSHAPTEALEALRVWESEGFDSALSEDARSDWAWQWIDALDQQDLLLVALNRHFPERPTPDLRETTDALFQALFRAPDLLIAPELWIRVSCAAFHEDHLRDHPKLAETCIKFDVLLSALEDLYLPPVSALPTLIPSPDRPAPSPSPLPPSATPIITFPQPRPRAAYAAAGDDEPEVRHEWEPLYPGKYEWYALLTCPAQPTTLDLPLKLTIETDVNVLCVSLGTTSFLTQRRGNLLEVHLTYQQYRDALSNLLPHVPSLTLHFYDGTSEIGQYTGDAPLPTPTL